ncbi:MAG: ABC transporter permease [Actinobacteria bacterium]|nr:ABC transporter permease [Actinomycetota bacterium]
MKSIPAGIKATIFGIASVVVLFSITQFILPGSGDGGGTPGAILFSGTVLGLLNALITMGVILIYRNIRIINFAQAAIGSIGGVFTYNFTVLNDWPFLLAAVAGLIVSIGVALLIELAFIRRFFNAPRLVLTVITIAFIAFLTGAAQYVSNLPIFGRVEDRTAEELAGSEVLTLPFADFQFTVGRLPLDFGFGHILAIGVSLAAMVGVALYLRFSKSGTAIRAVSENAERAPLLGISIGKLSLLVWGIAGLLSGLAVILNGAVLGRITRGEAPPEVLLTSFAAAVIARMRNFTTGILAAVGITILRTATSYSYREQLALLDVGLFLLIVVGLLVQRRERTRSEYAEASSWKAVEEYRSIPREMMEVPGVRLWKRGAIIVGVLALLSYPWLVSVRQIQLAGYFFLVGMVVLSLVVLTGWAGQVSIGQFALVAVGAVAGGAMTSRAGLSFWIAIIAVPLLVAGLAVLVGLPALRIRGLFLGIATFALAIAVHSALFNERYFGWLLPERVDRPQLLLLNFEEERSMYYLVLVGAMLMLLTVVVLRRSRTGRVLIALRENETNVQSFGVNLLRTRLLAFAVSGFICGFAGVLLAHHQRAVTESSFEAQLSLDIFLFAVIGGVGSISGAMLGTAYFAGSQLLSGAEPWNFIVGPVMILTILYVAPGGLAGLFFGLRDGVLRIVAQRRQMLVPALFSDMDPEAMRNRLIPLAEPIPSAGLNALPLDRRYRVSSEVYGSEGWLLGFGRRKPPKVSEDETALRAAGAGTEEVTPPLEAVAPAPRTEGAS